MEISHTLLKLTCGSVIGEKMLVPLPPGIRLFSESLSHIWLSFVAIICSVSYSLKVESLLLDLYYFVLLLLSLSLCKSCYFGYINVSLQQPADRRKQGDMQRNRKMQCGIAVQFEFICFDFQIIPVVRFYRKRAFFGGFLAFSNKKHLQQP